MTDQSRLVNMRHNSMQWDPDTPLAMHATSTGVTLHQGHATASDMASCGSCNQTEHRRAEVSALNICVYFGAFVVGSIH